MTDYLTTRQVQDILKVDRITIYRMLQDGRLKGVKVGSQWRFTEKELERLLNGESVLDPAPADGNNPVFPVHCVQTIQDLFSGVSMMGALVIDTAGMPVTQFSNPSDLSQKIMANPLGQADFQAAFRSFAQSPTETFVSPSGEHSAVAPIRDRGNVVGWFLVGQVFTAVDDSIIADQLAQPYGLDPAELSACLKQVATASADQWAQLQNWAVKASRAVESILHERTGFMLRLQRIADLTQV